LIIDELVAVAAGSALLVGPGALLLAALGMGKELRAEEKPAAAFSLTLALLAVPATISAFRPVSLELILAGLALVSVVAGAVAGLRSREQAVERRLASVAASRKAGVRPSDAAFSRDDDENDRAPRGLVIVAALAALLLAWGAHELTRGGSVDRWWYLAFVRDFLVEGRLGAADPMLGSGTELARFACNSWLAGLAVWARATGLDPVLLYERAAPVILAPLALSAAAGAVRALLHDRSAGLAAVVIAAAFYTSGGPFPALARLPEDKLLAALILAPVLWTRVLRTAERDSIDPTRLALVALVALALATAHPLVFVISLVTVGPALLIARAKVVAAIALVLMLSAVVPALVGFDAREQASEAASMEASEHPVGRIHLSRDRLNELGGELSVDPRLLSSPLTLLALATLPFLAIRRGRERALLVLPSLAALLLCFVPPLTSLLAKAVTPWMVYRFLWAIPFVALLAVLVRAAASRMPLGYAIPLLCIVAIAAPETISAIERRGSPARTALATPETTEFRSLVAALRELPETSVVAAAPELSERIPGLSGRYVLAASDRATVVFAGDADIAAARLRDRAALLAGIWRQSEGAPLPTHVLYAPGAPAARYCATDTLFASEHYVLCAFEAAEPPPGMKLPAVGERKGEASDPPATPDASETMIGERVQLAGASSPAYVVGCSPARDPDAGAIVFPRPGPWAATAPGVSCTLRRRGGEADNASARLAFRPVGLELEVVTGRAVEELTILVRGEREGGQRWNLRTRALVRHGDVLRYALPKGGLDRIEVTIVPSRLPFVKLAQLAIVLDDSTPSSTSR
jgi:hypothetical protein